MNKKTHRIKLISLLLVVSFAGDALCLWDMVENLGIGFNQVEREQEAEIAIHFHESVQTEHQSKRVDTCTLCPCCVSHVNLLLSASTLSISLSQLSILTLDDPREDSWSDHRFFHPPKLLA